MHTESHMNRSVKSLFIISAAALMLAGCGDVAEDGFTQAQLDAFIEEDYEDTSDTSSPDISAVEGDTAAGADTAGTDTVSGADDNDTEIQAENDPERVEYIGGLTYEEYEALSLEEQDALRDAERKKVTPPYEDSILPEYRELYDYNNAVIGYIYIDGTVIDAPVLQTLADYEYYLHRDIDGRESEPGCIILDADSEIGIGTRADGYLEGYEPTTIQLVHGHNMRNGTMFGSLLKYADESYADRHSIIQYDSIYEHRTYEVICAFYSQIYPEDSDDFKYYNYNQLDTEEEYEYWRENIDNMALYIRDVESGWGDEYIILSTCAYQVEDGRFAVVGVRTQ